MASNVVGKAEESISCKAHDAKESTKATMKDSYFY